MTPGEMWLKEPIDYCGCRATVMGLGSFGGGEGAARFLAERGALVTITDVRGESALAGSVQRLAGLPGIEWRLGRHEACDFRGIDLLVVNPAVPRSSSYLQIAVDGGVRLTSEMNLFWLHHRGRRIGVTGTNGKSTTACLIEAMLRQAGMPCRLGGNIGRSLLPVLDEIEPDEWVVLELSSFQLADLDHLRRSPHVAVVTNFAPNHLDRHASVEEYRAAKQSILRWQSAADVAVLNADDPDVAGWPGPGRRLCFGANDGCNARISDSHIAISSDKASFEIDLADHSGVPGRHNALNVAAAALAVIWANADSTAVSAAVRQFHGLPHRLQLVQEWVGRRIYNDSKATTPEAAIAALSAFGERPIVLLAGGSDKHVDLRPFAAAIARRTKAVALLGQTAEVLQRAIRAEAGTASPPTHCASSLEDAVRWALDQSCDGDVVLLSPGCASLDWFSSFEERGAKFADAVRALTDPATQKGR